MSSPAIDFSNLSTRIYDRRPKAGFSLLIWGCRRIIRMMTFREEKRHRAIGREFIQAMDALEFSSPRIDQVAMKRAYNLLKTRLGKRKNRASLEVWQSIEHRMMSYKIRKDEKWKEKEVDGEIFYQRLKAVAGTWKNDQLHKKNVHFTKRNEDNAFFYIYNIFMKFLMKHHVSKTREKFMDYCIGDGNSWKLFAIYPGLAEKLKRSYLSQMTGRYHETTNFHLAEKEIPAIRFVLYENGTKISKMIPLNDLSQELQVTPTKKVTLEDVFKSFESFDKDFGEFIYTVEGIRAWSSVDGCPPGEEPTFDLENWFDHFPVAELISTEKAQKAFAADLNGKNFGFGIGSTRLYNEDHPKDIYENHAQCIFLNPHHLGGYQVRYMSIFPRHFPMSFKDNLSYLGKTVEGRVEHCPNKLYAHRQYTRYVEVIEEKDDYRFAIEQMRSLAEKGYKGDLPFQIFASPCSKYIQDVFNAVRVRIGLEPYDVFKEPITDCTPSGPLKYPHKLFKVLPSFPRHLAIQTFFRLTIPGRTFNPKHQPLLKSPVFKERDHSVYQPSKLFELQKKGLFLSAKQKPWWIKKSKGV